MTLTSCAITGRCVKHLLTHGANLNSRDALYGETALHKAVKTEMLCVVEFLVKAGADVNAQDHAGNTPAHTAATHTSDLHVWNVLMMSNGDPNIKNRNGETVMAAAQRAKNLEGVAVLKQNFPSW